MNSKQGALPSLEDILDNFLGLPESRLPLRTDASGSSLVKPRWGNMAYFRNIYLRIQLDP